LLLPTTVSGPNWSPILSSTEHDVWKLIVCPLIEMALIEMALLNVLPSETWVVKPDIEMDALAGKVLVRAP